MPLQNTTQSIDPAIKRLKILALLKRKYDIAHTILPPIKKYRAVVGTNVVTGKKVYFEQIILAKDCGFHPACIVNCCKGRVKTHKGYVWEYVGDKK